MSVEIIAELATAHGGDVDLACDMVAAAAEAGAHTVKIQSYTLAKLNPKDPQAEWLRQAHLTEREHEIVMNTCETHRVRFLSTPFDAEALAMLEGIGCWRFKIASTEADRTWWHPALHDNRFVVSWPWGRVSPARALAKKGGFGCWGIENDLSTVPIYPTPHEATSAITLLDGYSDHTIGTAACRHMISKGASIIEAHFCLPGRSRQMPWDKTPEQLREIRDWADTVETMTTGVSTHFRERWSA